MVSLLGELNHILSLSYEPRERLVARLPKTVGISLTTSGCSPLSPGLPSSVSDLCPHTWCLFQEEADVAAELLLSVSTCPGALEATCLGCGTGYLYEGIPPWLG